MLSVRRDVARLVFGFALGLGLWVWAFWFFGVGDVVRVVVWGLLILFALQVFVGVAVRR